MLFPKYSIIVPIYKAEACLVRCVDSILMQSYNDFELLLIDDGSPDKSGEICDYYAKIDSRVRVFHKDNGGVSSARNLGIEKAKGEWIWFVDSDDSIVRTALSVIEKEITTSRSSIHSFAVNVICGNSRTTLNEFDVRLKADEEFGKLLTYEISGAPYLRVYKKDVLVDVRFSNTLHIGEDLLFNLNILFKYKEIKIHHVKDVIYNYIENKDSITKSIKTPYIKLYNQLNSEVYNFLLKNNIYEKYLTEYSIFQCINIFHSHLRARKHLSKQHMEKLNNNYSYISKFLTLGQKIYIKTSLISYCVGILSFYLLVFYRILRSKLSYKF